jgi:hypothetical protein
MLALTLKTLAIGSRNSMAFEPRNSLAIELRKSLAIELRYLIFCNLPLCGIFGFW